jgi:glycosyltransferase involved in cell wall biosynthesis
MLEPWAWRHKYFKKLPYYHLFERRLLLGAEAILATSMLEAQNLARFFDPGKIVTIPLGLPAAKKPAYETARRSLGWMADELVFVFLSRLHPKKGLDLLLRAFCRAADRLPLKWRLVIVGDGDPAYITKCKRIAHSNAEVGKRCEWTGAIWGEAKWSYYQGADLFCLPTHSENFGLAVLEAAQVGTRVLTTRNTPWAFLAASGGAFLVEPDVDSIHRGLCEFMTARRWSEADQNALSAALHQRFGWQSVGPKYLQLYEALRSPSAVPQMCSETPVI